MTLGGKYKNKMTKNEDIFIRIIQDIQNIIQVELNNEKIILATEKIKLRVNILNFSKIYMLVLCLNIITIYLVIQ